MAAQDVREETVQGGEAAVASRYLVMAITLKMLKKSGDQVGVEISYTQAVNRGVPCAGCVLEQKTQSIPVTR
jgi:hypothetical protein